MFFVLAIQYFQIFGNLAEPESFDNLLHLFQYLFVTFFKFTCHAGVATAFAARDVLGNILSGLSVQMSQPFSIGDTIKVC